MGIEAIAHGATGIITGFLAGSVAEWPVHKYILHNPDSQVPFIKGATQGHHWNHHPAYCPAEHYFEDGTNEQAVTHFSPSDVGIIMGASGGIGALLSQLPHVLKGQTHFGLNEGAFAGGFLVGAGAYYVLYETTHNLMHALNERRQHLYYTLGDALQNNQPDNNLRLSLPLLEKIAQEVRSEEFFQSETIDRLTRQVRMNRQKKGQLCPYIPFAEEEIPQVLEHVRKKEHAYEAERQQTRSWTQKLQDTVIEIALSSPTFQAMARHHYMHHFADHTNLNVVLPLMDHIRGTKVNSSIAQLEHKQALWHLPNPTARRAEMQLAA